MPVRGKLFVLVGFAGLFSAGCGTTRTTDTTRAATEMLLVSQAVDQVVAQIDFTPLAGKDVYLDVEFLDKTLVDRGYVISSVRQQLLAHGALIREEFKQATYIVEIRAGGLGTDRNTLLVGTPQVSLPAVVPGMPTNVPEIALVKRTDQKGVAKLGVFAYNRVTGRALWQSGMVEESSNLKDTWVFGVGPHSKGSIRKRTELAGEPLPRMPNIPLINDHPRGATDTAADGQQPHPTGVQPASLNQPHRWANADAPVPPRPVPFAMLGLVGPAAVVDRPLLK